MQELNARTLAITNPATQTNLHTLLQELRRDPFHCSLISEPLRGLYDYPHIIAYEFARAYCTKSGHPHQIPNIAIEYYADARFQASAITRGDAHLITVSAGVPALLTALFFEVFRSTHLVEVAASQDRFRSSFRIRQAWELDADQSAFSFLWSYMMGNRDNRRRLIRRLHCNHDDIPEIKLVARACYAITFVFLLLGQAQREVNRSDTHPSELVRITYLIAFAQTALEVQVPGVDPLRVEREVQAAHIQAEAAWNRLGLQFGVNDFSDTIEHLPQAIEHLRRRRERVGRAFGRYAWRFQPPQPA